jgi:predicted enzyme related to lactoylglutathione lyase
MSRIIHFEIPVENAKRAQRFYTGVFGWKFEGMPGGMEYWGVQTEEGGVNGGMMKRVQPGQGIMNYISVDSVEVGMIKVKEWGGKVLRSKTPVPGMGWFAVCQDTEGNVLGLWQTDPKAK